VLHDAGGNLLLVLLHALDRVDEDNDLGVLLHGEGVLGGSLPVSREVLALEALLVFELLVELKLARVRRVSGLHEGVAGGRRVADVLALRDLASIELVIVLDVNVGTSLDERSDGSSGSSLYGEGVGERGVALAVGGIDLGVALNKKWIKVGRWTDRQRGRRDLDEHGSSLAVVTLSREVERSVLELSGVRGIHIDAWGEKKH